MVICLWAKKYILSNNMSSGIALDDNLILYMLTKYMFCYSLCSAGSTCVFPLWEVYCDATDLLRQHFWEIPKTPHSTKDRRNRGLWVVYILQKLLEKYILKILDCQKNSLHWLVKSSSYPHVANCCVPIPTSKDKEMHWSLWCIHAAEADSKGANCCLLSLLGMCYNIPWKNKLLMEKYPRISEFSIVTETDSWS